MSRNALFIVIFALFCASAPAFAEQSAGEPTVPNHSVEPANPLDDITSWTIPTQLRPHQGWRFGSQALMAPVYLFAQMLTHESSHGLMGMMCGFEVDRFYPYPIVIGVQENEHTQPVDTFYWGLTLFEPRQVSDIEDWQMALTIFAPYMTDILLFTAGDLALTYGVDPHSFGAPFILAGLMMAPLGDFIIGMISLGERGDIHMFSDVAGIPVGVTAGIGWAMIIVALWRVAFQFRRIYMEPRTEPECEERAVSFSPFVGGDGAGLGVSGRF